MTKGFSLAVLMNFFGKNEKPKGNRHIRPAEDGAVNMSNPGVRFSLPLLLSWTEPNFQNESMDDRAGLTFDKRPCE